MTILLHGQPVSREALAEFKRLYQQALKAGTDHFILPDGRMVITAYAKYVVQYAEGRTSSRAGRPFEWKH